MVVVVAVEVVVEVALGNLRFKTTVNGYGGRVRGIWVELFCACVKVMGWRFVYRRVSLR